MPRTLSANRSFGCEANSDVSAADEARADARGFREAGRFLRLIEVVSEETHSADVPLTMGEVRVLPAENLNPSGMPDGGEVRGHLVPGYLNASHHKCMDSYCDREYHDGTMTDPDTIRRAGAKLKAIRARLGLSLREVGRLSLKLVAERGNSEFGLSRAWLTDIEKGRFVPGTFKIASLSTIYQLSIAEIHRLYGFEPGDIVKQRPLFRPPKTHLLVSVEEDDIENGLTVDDVLAKSGIENTDLLTRVVDIWGDIPVPLLRHVDLRRYLYGYIGIEDKTMSPLLPPGTFVQIDAKQARVQKGP
jgi:transcriptional regulator with XRE-family HTH domain